MSHGSLFSPSAGKAHNRRMFHLRGHDVASFPTSLEQTSNRGVIPLSPATGKNDFDGISRTDELSYLRARFGDFLAYLTPKAMNARRVAVQIGEKRLHRFEDFRCYASRRVVIEVNFRRHSDQPTLPSRLTPRSF